MASVTVRPAGGDDAAAVQAILDREIREGVAHFSTVPPTVGEVAVSIAETGRHPFRVGVVDGAVVGFARTTPWKPREAYAWSAEVGVYVAPGYHRTGVGRALVGEVLAAATGAGLRTFLAGIALPNPASVALFEGFGFAAAGVFPSIGFKHGRWWDVGYWSLAVGAGDPR